MIRAALLFAVVALLPSVAQSNPLELQVGGSVGHLYIYGDSYNDGNDMQPFLNTAGINDEQIRNMAHSGATLMPERYSTTCTEAGANISVPNCGLQIRYQAIPHPFTSICESEQKVGNVLGGDPSNQDACITEHTLSPNDMCVIQASSNDIANGLYERWDPVTGTPYFWATEFEDALEDILGQMDAVGIPCVMATGAPMGFGAASNGNDPGMDDNGGPSHNKVIEDYIIPAFQQAVIDHPNHSFVNVYQILTDWRTEYGDVKFAELYSNCATLGGDQDTDCTDGVHMSATVESEGVSGRQVMFEPIIDELFYLNERRVGNAPIFVGN